MELLKLPEELIYIVSNDDNLLEQLETLFNRAEFTVTTFLSLEGLPDNIKKSMPHCIVAETKSLEISPQHFVHQIKEQIPIIVLGSKSDIPTAVGAINSGAADFIELPIIDRVLVESVQKAISSFQSH